MLKNAIKCWGPLLMAVMFSITGKATYADNIPQGGIAVGWQMSAEGATPQSLIAIKDVGEPQWKVVNTPNPAKPDPAYLLCCLALAAKVKRVWLLTEKV